jgi:tetratricopeptide (TPR) repeat protein
LRQFGSFERLPQRLHHYLKADNPKDLFLRVLARWQEDFDGKDPEQDRPKLDLVRRALTQLWAARHGLSEPEWLDLLGNVIQTSDTDPIPSSKERAASLANFPLPRAFWTPFFLALSPHLDLYGGLLGFGHDFLRQAVQELFVPTRELQKRAHHQLSRFFARYDHMNVNLTLTPRQGGGLNLGDAFARAARQTEMDWRMSAEWPYQLFAAEAWDELEGCLLDIHLFWALCVSKTEWELSAYWRPLREKGRNMVEGYTRALDQLVTDPAKADAYSVASELGRFLEDNGLYSEAEPFIRRALEGRERILGTEHPDTLASFHALARLMLQIGNFEEAETLSRRYLATCRQVLGIEHPGTLAMMSNLAVALHKRGNITEAGKLYQHLLPTAERVLGPEHPSSLQLLNNMAQLLESKGELVEARELYRRAMEGHVRVLGKEHPDTLVNMSNLSLVLSHLGHVEESELLCRQVLEIRDRVLGPEHPETLISLHNLAGLLENKGDFVGAESTYHCALDGHERVLGPEHPNTLTCMRGLADLLTRKGDYGAAQRLHVRVFECRERTLGLEHPKTLESLANLASLLEKQGDLVEAESLYQRALAKLCQASATAQAPHPRLPAVLDHYGRFLKRKGLEPKDVHNILGQFLQQFGLGLTPPQPLVRDDPPEPSLPQGPNQLDRLESNYRLAQSFMQNSDYARAEPLFRETLLAREQALGKEHPDTLCVANSLALVLKRKGDFAAAKLLYQRTLDARERVLGTDHPQTLTSVNNLAALFFATGDLTRSETLYRRTLEARERVLGAQHTDTLESMNNLAMLLSRKGDDAGAESLCRRLLDTRERLLGQQHPDTSIGVSNLAALLAKRGHHTAAQPLFERAIKGLLQISAERKYTHPNLQGLINSYAECLGELGRGPEEVRGTLEAMLRPFGINLGINGERERHLSTGQSEPKN